MKKVNTSIIDAVNETKADIAEVKTVRQPSVKKLTKRILHAIGNGLRTSTSIANALGLPKSKIQSNLHHMKSRGHVYSSKQTGKLEHKYHLTTEKPTLGTTDLTKKKARKPYTKRVTKDFNADNALVQHSQAHCQALQSQLNEKSSRLNALELCLIEKEKEVWTLECEVFDKKAVIKYLEEKLFVLGVK